MRVRIGARRSPLAVAQATWVASRLEALGAQCELVGITSQGDVDQRELTQIGGTGVFAAAVRQAVLTGEVDLAVHSLKDLPTDSVDGLDLIAVPQREDPRDVLIGPAPAAWATLPNPVVIGSGSPRRVAQLAALARRHHADVRFEPIRGNVSRRISQVTDGHLTATVLAAAGLRRLGLLSRTAAQFGVSGATVHHVFGIEVHLLDVDDMLPAAGQAALAVECRSDAAPELRSLAASVDDGPTRLDTTIEREFLAAMEAGCTAPVGALSQQYDGILTLRVCAEKMGDARVIALRRSCSTTSVAGFARSVAHEMLSHLSR